MRERYRITEEQCFGREVLCYVVFCTCCAITQMASHRANYDVVNVKYFPKIEYLPVEVPALPKFVKVPCDSKLNCMNVLCWAIPYIC